MANILKTIAIFIFIFFAYPVFAYVQDVETLVIEHNNAITNPPFCQSFLAPSNYISDVGFYLKNYVGTETVLNVKFCKGIMPTTLSDYLSGVYPNRILRDCTYIGNTNMDTFQMSVATTTLTFTTANIDLEMIEGDQYYFCFDSEVETTAVAMAFNNTNPYADGYVNNNTGLDLGMTIYESMEIPDDWTQNWFTIDDTRADFYVPINTVCLIGEPCRVSLYYNDLAIGKTFYIIEETTPIFPEYAIGSYTIEDSLLNEFIFTYPNESTSTSDIDYCIYLEDEVDGDVINCGSQINWREADIYLNNIIDDNYCSEEKVCSDIASSTLFYGFECSMKRTFCWAFKPSIESVETFKKTVTNLEGSFPFNTVFSLLNYTQNNIEEKTSDGNAGGEFGVIMIDDNGDYYIHNFINSYTYTDTIGSSTTSTIEQFADYIIWTIVGFLIVFIVIKYSFLNK